MRYIHQHPTERRFATDIAYKVGMSEASLSKVVNRDFPHVFKRIPRVGIALTGKWPIEGKPIDLTGKGLDPKFEWNPLMLKAANTLWKKHTDQTLLEYLQVADPADIESVQSLGEHIAEMAKQLIRSGAVGTARQDEWTPE